MLKQPDRDEVNAMIDRAVSGAYAGLGGLRGGLGNYIAITQGVTTNPEGAGGPTIVALVKTTVKASGIFLWSVSADAAAVAADVGTWTVTSQSGAGAVTSTGGGAPGGVIEGKTGSSFSALVATAVAGTGIVITAGGGGELTQYTRAETEATAGANDTVSASGIMQNSVTAAAGANVPFGSGVNVFLVLKYTNSVANRAITSINMSLLELPI